LTKHRACGSVAAATMKLYVGITDRDWYQFLSTRPGLDEVNFWQPSGSRAFRVLKPGDRSCSSSTAR
jgi:hypothetical protein